MERRPGVAPASEYCCIFDCTLTLFPRAGFEPRSSPPGTPKGVVRFVVSEGSRCFEGHFDGSPILPGVAQVALVLTACAMEAGRSVELTGLRDVRFKRPIRPGDHVEVALSDGDDRTVVPFEIRCGGEAVTSGYLVVAPCTGVRIG